MIPELVITISGIRTNSRLAVDLSTGAIVRRQAWPASRMIVPSRHRRTRGSWIHSLAVAVTGFLRRHRCAWDTIVDLGICSDCSLIKKP